MVQKKEKLMKLDLEIKILESLYQLRFSQKLAVEDKIEAHQESLEKL